MRNRYGNEYGFEAVNANTYRFVGDLQHCRMGGQEGQNAIDFEDLGFVDPSGGPFMGLGYKINGRTVTRIRAVGNDVLLEVVP
jgi:hypothetical protein